ncbi:hypothetical protein PUR49_15470 [Streptomyces sp. BE147]|uniref:hypothetical protein n=1 Tax=Streptomyces sp. BE147 TaxID=3002524 RepID=UPI002E78C6BF|nr:hypothetical protein [Streptomyces sp. BE147]MEE1737889.1 hypothetical protein [Streptomyces sp. BE147]
MIFDEAADGKPSHLYEDYALLRVVTVDERVIAIEWGYRGSIPEIARRASVNGGEFFSVQQAVNGHSRVIHTFAGRVDGMFDPADLEDAPWVDPVPEIPSWAAGVAFRPGTLGAESLALMEHVMGVPVDPALMGAPLCTALLASPDALFGGLEGAWNL